MTCRIEYSVGNIIEADMIPHGVESHTITGLMKGTSYLVRVALSNSAGQGAYSSSEIGRTDVDRECLTVVRSHGITLFTLLSLVCLFLLVW